MIKLFISIITILGVGYYYFIAPDDVAIIKIDDLSKPQEIEIKFKRHYGWVGKTHEIIENTAIDSVALGGSRLIPPGWTGITYHNDELNVEPRTFHYKATRPVKGSIRIKYSVKYLK